MEHSVPAFIAIQVAGGSAPPFASYQKQVPSNPFTQSAPLAATYKLQFAAVKQADPSNLTEHVVLKS